MESRELAGRIEPRIQRLATAAFADADSRSARIRAKADSSGPAGPRPLPTPLPFAEGAAAGRPLPMTPTGFSPSPSGTLGSAPGSQLPGPGGLMERRSALLAVHPVILIAVTGVE